jgi:hypothetical protein
LLKLPYLFFSLLVTFFFIFTWILNLLVSKYQIHHDVLQTSECASNDVNDFRKQCPKCSLECDNLRNYAIISSIFSVVIRRVVNVMPIIFVVVLRMSTALGYEFDECVSTSRIRKRRWHELMNQIPQISFSFSNCTLPLTWVNEWNSSNFFQFFKLYTSIC